MLLSQSFGSAADQDCSRAPQQLFSISGRRDRERSFRGSYIVIHLHPEESFLDDGSIHRLDRGFSLSVVKP